MLFSRAHNRSCERIAFGPPLIVTAEQVDEMVAILDRSLGEVLSELDDAASIPGWAESSGGGRLP